MAPPCPRPIAKPASTSAATASNSAPTPSSSSTKCSSEKKSPATTFSGTSAATSGSPSANSPASSPRRRTHDAASSRGLPHRRRLDLPRPLQQAPQRHPAPPPDRRAGPRPHPRQLGHHRRRPRGNPGRRLDPHQPRPPRLRDHPNPRPYRHEYPRNLARPRPPHLGSRHARAQRPLPRDHLVVGCFTRVTFPLAREVAGGEIGRLAGGRAEGGRSVVEGRGERVTDPGSPTQTPAPTRS